MLAIHLGIVGAVAGLWLVQIYRGWAFDSAFAKLCDQVSTPCRSYTRIGSYEFTSLAPYRGGYLVGAVELTPKGRRVHLMELSDQLQENWDQPFGILGGNPLVAVDGDGKVYFAVASTLFKVTADAVAWQVDLWRERSFYPSRIASDRAGVLLCGKAWVEVDGVSKEQATVLKVDERGAVAWVQHFVLADHQSGTCTAVTPVAAGGYLVATEHYPDVALHRLTPGGDIIWTKVPEEVGSALGLVEVRRDHYLMSGSAKTNRCDPRRQVRASSCSCVLEVDDDANLSSPRCAAELRPTSLFSQDGAAVIAGDRYGTDRSEVYLSRLERTGEAAEIAHLGVRGETALRLADGLVNPAGEFVLAVYLTDETLSTGHNAIMVIGSAAKGSARIER